MFSLFKGASLKIAQNLIQVTGIQKTLDLFKEKNLSNVAAEDALKLILGLNACNLMQTMREDFIEKEIDSEDRQDIVDDYLVENLRIQKWDRIKDGADLMEKCQEIEGISEKLRAHWLGEEDPNGPGPRYYCVKDVLRRLGNEDNHKLHDALFEFVYLQHNHFVHYFRTLLEPMEPNQPLDPPAENSSAGPT